ncbi:hypothetical protein ERC79_15775 [Rhodococcus sp. ABRD24]|uniref:peptidase inhibitor family I36 protein n=1 Tax=Rhodococcus sp. ABRD24 TaxID=2507582 RepID=UPI001040705C|nr:peptidase inhibitor family I36 protein [Rhodococcus sp. ABRD24]QBJ97239.1 hypothetical protein ERC79_15775 [Rhodococcus sp. ABRD24]
MPGTALAGSNLRRVNQVCIYDNQGFGAQLGWRWGTSTNVENMSGTANDKLSSWENRSSAHAAWYEHGNGQGICHTMFAFSENSYVGFADNDEASSWKTRGAC